MVSEIALYSKYIQNYSKVLHCRSSLSFCSLSAFPQAPILHHGVNEWLNFFVSFYSLYFRGDHISSSIISCKVGKGNSEDGSHQVGQLLLIMLACLILLKQQPTKESGRGKVSSLFYCYHHTESLQPFFNLILEGKSITVRIPCPQGLKHAHSIWVIKPPPPC